MGALPTLLCLFGLGGREGGRVGCPPAVLATSSPKAFFKVLCLACRRDIRLLSSK